MKAEYYVEQVKKFDKLIEKKKDQREEYLAMATCITSQMGGERVQSSGNKQKMEDAVIELVEMGEQILLEYNELIRKRREIVVTLEELDATGYEVLYMMYIGRMKISKNGTYRMEYLNTKEIASEFGMTDAWVRYERKKALAALQKILDEREKAVN